MRRNNNSNNSSNINNNSNSSHSSHNNNNNNNSIDSQCEQTVGRYYRRRNLKQNHDVHGNSSLSKPSHEARAGHSINHHDGLRRIQLRFSYQRSCSSMWARSSLGHKLFSAAQWFFGPAQLERLHW